MFCVDDYKVSPYTLSIFVTVGKQLPLAELEPNDVYTFVAEGDFTTCTAIMTGQSMK